MADQLRKYKSLYSSTANTFGIGTGVTITPASVVGLPTDTEINLTFDRVDSSGTATPSKLERIIGTVSGGNLAVRTSPASGRGADSTTEQAHTSPVVEMVWNAKDLNDLIEWALGEHNQDGTHGAVTADSVTSTGVVTGSHFDLAASGALRDANNNELLAFVQTASAVNEVKVSNAATGGNPVVEANGGDTNISLDLKGKGTGTVRKPTSVSIQVIGPTTDLTTGDGKFYLSIPPELAGLNLIGVYAEVITAGTTNTTDIQIHNLTQTADMLSTKLTIDSTEKKSTDAATPAVIDTDNDDVALNDLLRVDIDAVSTTAPKGLILRLTFGF